MRTSHSPPTARASAKLPTAATREPKWSGPVGEGAKRRAALCRRVKRALAPFGRRRPLAAVGHSAALLLADLVQGLAVDAERGGRPGLQPAHADLDAAGLAVAVVVLVDAAPTPRRSS
jgi:hypothetical protein